MAALNDGVARTTGLNSLSLAACTGAGEPDSASPPEISDDTGNPAAGTRPSGQPALVTKQGRIGDGVECATLTTPDGELWSFTMGDADFEAGDYVSITGEIADASFCQQGQATLIVQDITEAEPPARDRDPAKAGGIAPTADYLIGDWVAKGVDADCASPDFAIRRSPGALVLEAEIDGHDNDAVICLGDYPRLDLDEPRQDLPMEARRPDGVAILRPASDAAYDPLTIGSASIAGDGVVFVRCG